MASAKTYDTKMGEKVKREACATCGGHGVVEDVVNTIEPGCCGNPHPWGECCGNPIPVQGQEIVQVGCADCNGTGREALQGGDNGE